MLLISYTTTKARRPVTHDSSTANLRVVFAHCPSPRGMKGAVMNGPIYPSPFSDLLRSQPQVDIHVR